MNERRRIPSFSLFLLFCLLAVPVAHAVDNVCDPGEAPDLVIGDIQDKGRYGVVGDITGFAVGNYTCNLGTCQGNWLANVPQHPLFGQNMFRLKGGRLEHIGQSWLKHGFSALQTTICSSSCLPGSSTALGVNCSDPYTWSLNGAQARLGPKFEVNANTGVYPYPATNGTLTGDAIYKRLQVHHADLDPAQNAGAQYFVELQVIAPDDSTGRNQHNNASYRPVTVTGSAGNYDFTLTGTTQRAKAGIEAWKAVDPAVAQTDVSDGENGRIIVAGKATQLSAFLWHYEYAVQNMNSQRAVGSFQVPIPPGTSVTNIGFHDVEYHSGEPFDGTDWIGEAGPTAVSWSTNKFSENPNANALRWGTLYNFRFDADVAPATHEVALGIFRPGTPTSVSASTVTPEVCNHNGTCEGAETCANCAVDCASQGGGTGCCGNGTCEVGENPCLCLADCGNRSPSEVFCGNGIDEDCDGQRDCADNDCCTDAACQGNDNDLDGYAVCDCDDNNPQAWRAPGEAIDLRLTRTAGDVAQLSWSPPASPGCSAPAFDALRSSSAADFVSSATCLLLDPPTTPAVSDAADPAPGAVYFYLVRARNACPNGLGPFGQGTSGTPRVGRTCP